MLNGKIIYDRPIYVANTDRSSQLVIYKTQSGDYNVEMYGNDSKGKLQYTKYLMTKNEAKGNDNYVIDWFTRQAKVFIGSYLK